MRWVFILTALYLTYYTFRHAKSIWKGGNKPAGAFLFVMTACFLPLGVVLYLK